MMRFTIKDKTFKKLYDLNNPAEDFSFANSLVIDDQSGAYYGLVFPQHQYNSNLRLIVGSVANNSYKIIGTPIPYSFNDIHSFADLFYCSKSKKIIAVTLLRSDKDQTKVSIYTLQGPPLETLQTNAHTPKSRFALFFTGMLGLLALIADAALFYFSQRKRSIPKVKETATLAQLSKEHMATKNAVFLFGDLQIFDNDGIDVTRLLSPLLKELFLLLLLNSIKNGRGLNAEKLDEILWFGKSEKSVRNNRSVNLAKLKSILEKLGYCQLSKTAGYWKIEINYEHCYVDYQNYLKLIEDKKNLNEEQIKLLFELTRRGNFLSNHDYEWLDQFKSEISNEVIDVFLSYASSAKPYNAEFLIQIASFIFYFDPVNEEAMRLKCKALASLGKHSLAKKTFDLFVKDYQSIYNEDFNKNFNQII